MTKAKRKVCNKIPYTYKQAGRIARVLTNKFGVSQYRYHCPKCGKYHTTKNPLAHLGTL